MFTKKVISVLLAVSLSSLSVQGNLLAKPRDGRENPTTNIFKWIDDNINEMGDFRIMNGGIVMAIGGAVVEFIENKAFQQRMKNYRQIAHHAPTSVKPGSIGRNLFLVGMIIYFVGTILLGEDMLDNPNDLSESISETIGSVGGFLGGGNAVASTIAPDFTDHKYNLFGKSEAYTLAHGCPSCVEWMLVHGAIDSKMPGELSRLYDAEPFINHDFVDYLTMIADPPNYRTWFKAIAYYAIKKDMIDSIKEKSYGEFDELMYRHELEYEFKLNEENGLNNRLRAMAQKLSQLKIEYAQNLDVGEQLN